MNDITSIFNLPLETLIVLGSGFLAYRLAYAGRERDHRAIDVTFTTLAFGMIAKIIIMFWPYQPVIGFALAVCAPIIIAAIWRKWIQGAVAWVLRKMHVLNYSGTRDVWVDVITDTKPTLDEVTVNMKNGRSFISRNIHQFRNLPNGPIQFGLDGSVFMYVNWYRDNRNEAYQYIDVTEEGVGHDITFIPAREIEYIELKQR